MLGDDDGEQAGGPATGSAVRKRPALSEGERTEGLGEVRSFLASYRAAEELVDQRSWLAEEEEQVVRVVEEAVREAELELHRARK